jgi:hypothetical protein
MKIVLNEAKLPSYLVMLNGAYKGTVWLFQGSWYCSGMAYRNRTNNWLRWRRWRTKEQAATFLLNSYGDYDGDLPANSL